MKLDKVYITETCRDSNFHCRMWLLSNPEEEKQLLDDSTKIDWLLEFLLMEYWTIFNETN